MSNNSIPSDIKPWVAGPNQGPRPVVQPCYIDPHALDDLAVYHPGFGGSITLAMRHVAAQDDVGWYVKTEVDDQWHEDMMIAMNMLRLEPTTINGRPALHDPRIASRKTPLMHGWKVIEWQVFKTRDSSLDRVHQDLIFWQKHDNSTVKALSLFSWRVYIDEAAPSFAAKRTMNEGPFVLQQFIR
jgi:hypothetical protein